MKARLRRALAPGLLVAVPALPWVWNACVRASWATLGRDQGIFQYVAWAVSDGAKVYRDIRDVNGPLVVLVHQILLAFGGADEHRFRVLDLLFVGATAAFAGACLPSLTRSRRASRSATMALAAAVVALAQYVAYGFWDTAQRESFLDGFIVVSMGLQWLAQARLRIGAPRGALALTRSEDRALLLLAGAGAASLAPWFGKPTSALFTVGQLAALLLDDVPARRLRRLCVFAAGGAVGAAVPLAYLASHGDLAAWARISFVDVPTMYRFIWPRTTSAVLALHRDAVAIAVVASLPVVALVGLGRVPRRALSLATFPIAGIAAALLQRKGFAYHFHPVTLGSWLALLALVDFAWTEVESWRLRAVAAVLAAALGARAGLVASRAPDPEPVAAPEGSEQRLAPFVRTDFFPYPLRQAAEHVAARVPKTETVQVYGMDPYLLFLARRRSATPYIYAYDLDADAALHGSYDEDGPAPDDAQRARILAMREEHERDLLARLDRSPPGAFVFIDRSPLITNPDALRDFEEHCPEATKWMLLRYRESANFDGMRVLLRADLAGEITGISSAPSTDRSR